MSARLERVFSFSVNISSCVYDILLFALKGYLSLLSGLSSMFSLYKQGDTTKQQRLFDPGSLMRLERLLSGELLPSSDCQPRLCSGTLCQLVVRPHVCL